MKNLRWLGSIALLALAAGCASSKESRTDAPDGFYVHATEGAQSYTLKSVPPEGGPPVSVPIQEYDGFLPQRLAVVERPQAIFIQISGVGTGNWMDQAIVLVANHRPYLPVRKSPLVPAVTGKTPGSPATVFLAVSTRKEADKIAAAVRKRYSVPPELVEPPGMN